MHLLVLFTRNLLRCKIIHSFIHSVFCLTIGPKPPPKRCLHIVRSRASSFKWEYPLLSLRSFSSFLRLLPRLLATSISPFIFPSISCFIRQFLKIVSKYLLWMSPLILYLSGKEECRSRLDFLYLAHRKRYNLFFVIASPFRYLHARKR